MVKIYAKVTTAGGFDTRFLFPGLVPHFYQGGSFSTSYATYEAKVIRNGDANPPQQIGNYYLYKVSADDLSINDNTYTGHISGWTVQDQYDPSHAILASLSIDGTPGHLTFRGLSIDDLISREWARDQNPQLVVTGYTGNDTLRGSFWDDELDGKGGADSMIGGDGDDKYTVNHKGDKVVESAKNGSDTVLTTISYTLPSNVETLTGAGSKALALTGNTLTNTLSGTVANDTLKGLGGGDLLAGSNGKDELWGGTGKDVFYFTAPPASANVDTVKDFKSADDDIWLYRGAFPGLVAPTDPAHTVLAASKFYSSNAGLAHDPTDRIIYDANDGLLYLDLDGNGSGARKLIAIFTGHPTLTNADIFII